MYIYVSVRFLNACAFLKTTKMYPIFASFIPDPTSLKLGKREKFEDSGGNTTMTTLKLAFKNNKSVHLYLNTHVSVYNQKLNQKSTYYEFLKTTKQRRRISCARSWVALYGQELLYAACWDWQTPRRAGSTFVVRLCLRALAQIATTLGQTCFPP